MIPLRSVEEAQRRYTGHLLEWDNACRMGMVKLDEGILGDEEAEPLYADA
ncbi:unnamed protein product [Durusdinium trenchii]|uniref:Uncharacterized protein n=1 Tax=Durusdinium trenchii TaxID=1381693 RepID=A0ABP0JLA8_9DINO